VIIFLLPREVSTVFSFFEDNYTILEANVAFDDAQERYPDSYMVTINGHVKDKRIHGDIIAILSQDEYNTLVIPQSIAPKFSVLEGLNVVRGKVGNSLGVYL